MQLSIRNAAGERSEAVEKHVVAGRTVLRLKRGERLEILDPATGAVPAGVKAHRGGHDGRDLIVETEGELIQVEGFFDLPAQGDEAVAVEFPGGAAAEITPATPELAMPGAAFEAAPLASSQSDAGLVRVAQAEAAAAAPAAAATAPTAAAAAGASTAASAAAASASSFWWIAGGVAAAGAAAAALSSSDSGGDAPVPPPSPPPAPVPTFDLVASAATADEGDTVTFTLNTTNVAVGTQYTYTLSGISASDVEGGMLTGTVTIDASGKAVIGVRLLADLTTEGLETLTATVAGESISVEINDVSTTPPPTPEPAFSLVAGGVSVGEGEVAAFTLSTTNVAPGSLYTYTLSGISPDDVVGGLLTGTVTIDSNGQAVILVALKADLTTEGPETLHVSVAGQTASVEIADLSTTPVPTFSLAADAPSVDEGQAISFTLQTINVPAGTQYHYTVTGISPQDIVGGSAALTGTVTIDANGRAVIELHPAADLTTEGAETLTLQIAGQTVSVEVNDLSRTPTFILTANDDDVLGTRFDDAVVGTDLTFNAADVIDGGEGNDKLSLVLAAGSSTGGASVSNIETLNVRTGEGDSAAHLVMTGFDSNVTQINVRASRADLSITDQQSLAKVSIEDTTSDVTLGYDSQVVLGSQDTLDLTVDEFGGTLHVDGGIEALKVQVNDGADESSAITLAADGVTSVTVTGGIAGQKASFDVAVNAERAAGARFDATGFAGDVVLTNIGGGSKAFAYAIEITQSLQPGETILVTVDGREFSYTHPPSPGPELVPLDLVTVIGNMIATELCASTSFSALDAGGVSQALVLFNLEDPLSITVQVGAAALNVRDAFSYTEFGGTSSSIVAPVVHSEISTMKLGAGNDTVVIGDVTSHGHDLNHGDDYDLGDGDNSLTILEGSVHGTVKFGAGDGNLDVGGEIGAGAIVMFGSGESHAVAANGITGNASISFAGGDNTLISGDDIKGSASVAFNGADSNVLNADYIRQSAAVTFGDGDNVANLLGVLEAGSVTFGNGNNNVGVSGEAGIRDAATLTFGNGDNVLNVESDIRGEDVTITFGNGENSVSVDGDIRSATLTFGDGDNRFTVEDDVKGVTATFGDGANTVVLDDGAQKSTLTFGDGDNSVTIDDDLSESSLTFGDGANEVALDDELVSSTMTFGNGGNTVSVAEGVRGGSQITFGSGKDSFTLGDEPIGEGGDLEPWLEGKGVMSVVSLGDGDDTANIIGSAGGAVSAIVRSGGRLEGGAGQDVLTVRAVDDIDNLVARTDEQKVAVEFEGPYTVGQVVSVTIAGATFSYLVKAGDIVQGDDASTNANVAAGVLQSINAVEDPDVTPALSACSGGSSNIIQLKGQCGAADVAVTSSGGTVKVLQIADAGISGFETLNLISVNAIDKDVEDGGTDNDSDSADITVDFSLITDVTQINLKSEAAVRSEVESDGVVNGAYTRSEEGDAVVFSLVNLPATLGEHITVSGNEVTTTGNRQVERITIGAGNGDHEIGDVITVRIGDAKYSITVTEGDLSGATAQDDANNIATRLADLIEAGSSGFTVARDGNLITLIGTSDDDVRVKLHSDGDNDELCNLQDAAAVDDETTDVYLNAVLAQEADTEDDTLSLTINGTGNFDLAIDGAWNGVSLFSLAPGPAYENLTLNVLDSFSHYIDTDSNDDDAEFVGGKITLTGGAAGASIVIADVMAHTVTSTSEANVTVDFDGSADSGGDQAAYTFSVSTAGGNDVVDMRDLVLTSRSSIDLGAGTDRLIISNGRHRADDAMGGSAPVDEGRMFRNVSNVEELEVHMLGYHHGRDGITFDDDAYEAGFSKLIVGEDSKLTFTLGDEFERDLTVEIKDDVRIDMAIYNDEAVNVTAGDDLDAKIVLKSGAAADFTMTADDKAEVDLSSSGSGDISVTLDERAELSVKQWGDGAVTLAADRHSKISLDQRGAGAVAVTAAAGSSVEVDYGFHNDNIAALTVTQTGSDKNKIELKHLNEKQDVTVDITVYGHNKETTVADRTGRASHDTNLEVKHSDGGIDKLVLRSDADRGASSVVTAVIDDTWAVARSGAPAEGYDFTADASAVSADYVFLNGSQEDDASLQLIGSKTAFNVIMGGALGDSLKGGDQSDVLFGDRVDGRPQITSVVFQSSYDAGDVLTLTVNGKTITATVGATSDVTGAELAAAVAAYINSNGSNDDSELITVAGDSTISSVVAASVSGLGLILTGTSIGQCFHAFACVDNDNPVGPAPHVQEISISGWGPGEGLILSSNGLPEAWNSHWFTGTLEDALNAFLAANKATIEIATGGTFTINGSNDGFILTGPGDGTPLTLVFTGGQITDGVGGAGTGSVTVETTAPLATPTDQGVLTTVTQEAESGVAIMAASDTLEGGAGRDFYLFAESQFDTMDTIVGLKLDATPSDDPEAAPDNDIIALGAYISAGAYEGIEDNAFQFLQLEHLLRVDTVVNNGAAVSLAGADLQTAVNTLFQANGWFEQSGSAATNAAGLFTWGNDTYLIATGHEKGSGFGGDDFIIKVTGVTGTLDVLDFFQPA